jgi:hypothetical protein
MEYGVLVLVIVICGKKKIFLVSTSYYNTVLRYIINILCQTKIFKFLKKDRIIAKYFKRKGGAHTNTNNVAKTVHSLLSTPTPRQPPFLLKLSNMSDK